MDTTRGSLLLRVRNPGDSQAWGEFDGIYRPMLYRFARARGLDDADAEDIAQQCMAAVSRHIRSFEYDPSTGRFKGWLRTLVNNRVRNWLRDRKDQIAQTKDFRRVQEREASPEEIFDQIWMDEHLRYCTALIRPEVGESTFEVFQHYVLEEWPVEDVCRTHKMSANQVYQIKWRVTKKLGETLKELLAGSE